MQLFTKATVKSDAQSWRDHVLWLLQSNGYLTPTEGRTLDIPALSSVVTKLRDDGYPVETLRFGGRTRYVLKSGGRDETLGATRSQAKETRARHLEDDKEEGYVRAEQRVIDAEVLIGGIERGLTLEQFEQHPNIGGYPANIRGQLWDLYESLAA